MKLQEVFWSDLLPTMSVFMRGISHKLDEASHHEKEAWDLILSRFVFDREVFIDDYASLTDYDFCQAIYSSLLSKELDSAGAKFYCWALSDEFITRSGVVRRVLHDNRVSQGVKVVSREPDTLLHVQIDMSLPHADIVGFINNKLSIKMDIDSRVERSLFSRDFSAIKGIIDQHWDPFFRPLRLTFYS